ncbi:hypothetical protein D3C87_1880340 [compost metagenome]
MVSHGSDVFLQRRFAGEVVFGIEVALVGHQRHFGIDNHVFALRQTHNHIGLHSRAGIGLDADLSFIFVAIAQPGSLQYASQHDFPPVALSFVITFERARQIDRLLRHLRV